VKISYNAFQHRIASLYASFFKLMKLNPHLYSPSLLPEASKNNWSPSAGLQSSYRLPVSVVSSAADLALTLVALAALLVEHLALRPAPVLGPTNVHMS
jgi:hypothetical protein